jgi:hypothetical protein
MFGGFDQRGASCLDCKVHTIKEEICPFLCSVLGFICVFVGFCRPNGSN